MAIFMLINKMGPETEDQVAQSADLQTVQEYTILESLASKAVIFVYLRVFSHIQNTYVSTVCYSTVSGDMLEIMLYKLSPNRKQQTKALLTISSSSKPNSKQSSSNSSSAVKEEGEF